MKLRRVWGGPGIGWLTPGGRACGKTWTSKFQASIDRMFDDWIADEIRAGRLPGNQEKTMSHFRFPLGALVVLSSSFAFAAKEAEHSDRDVHQAAERQAVRAKEEAYRAAGRSDLIERKDTASHATAWAIARMDPPIEAGKIIGRAEHLHSENNYLVRYQSGGTTQVDGWLNESALEFDPRVKTQPTDADSDADESLDSPARNG